MGYKLLLSFVLAANCFAQTIPATDPQRLQLFQNRLTSPDGTSARPDVLARDLRFFPTDIPALKSMMQYESADLLSDGKYHGRLMSKPQLAQRQVMNSALWRTDHGFRSIIHLNNALVTSSLTVSPTLYMADGSALPLPAVAIAPNGVAAVDINDALSHAPADLTTHISDHGSVQLAYTFSFSGSLKAAVDIVDLNRSLSYTYMFYDIPPVMTGPHTIEGMWWKRDTGVTGFLTLANTSNQPQQVTVQGSIANGTLGARHTYSSGAHETLFLDLDVILGALRHGSYGGITIRYGGSIGDILVAGGLENPSEGYSNRLPLQMRMGSMAGAVAPAGQMSAAVQTEHSLTAVGVLNGMQEQVMGFGPETVFTPYAVVRNVGSHSVTMTEIVHYMFAGEPTTTSLGLRSIDPNETVDLQLAKALSAHGVPDTTTSLTVSVVYTSATSDLLLQTGSVDQSGNYVFDVEPNGSTSSLSKPVRYWAANGAFDTMFSLFNTSTTATYVTLVLHFSEGSGHYTIPVHLKGNGAAEIDIGDLIRKQAPDGEGNTIPVGVEFGSAVLSDPVSEINRITVQMAASEFSVTYGTCSPVNCYTCDGFVNAALTADWPAGNYGSPLSTMQMHALATYYTGTVYDETGYGIWQTSNGSVATIGVTGVMTPTAAGTANITWTENVELNLGYECAPTSPCYGWVSGGYAQVGIAPAVTFGANTGGYQDIGNVRFCNYSKNCSAGTTATCPPNSNTWNYQTTVGTACAPYIKNLWVVVTELGVRACFGAVEEATGAGPCS